MGWLTGLLLMVMVPAQAQLFCSEPTEPYCIGPSMDDSDWSFSSCRSQVQNYLADVDRYRQCLIRRANDAIDEANRVVDRFNCYADGRSFCY